MAERPDTEETGEEPAPKKGKRGKHGEPGHNLSAIRTKAEPLFKALDKLKKDKDAAAGEFTTDMNNKYTAASKAMGVPVAILRREFRRLLARRREAEEEMQMEMAERDQIEAMRDALGDTPLFGHYVQGKLAKGAAA